MGSPDVLPVNFGVPQGGILSALAFLLYINDVINCDESADFILYADDTTIYLADENLGELYSKARDAVSNFKLWCDSSKLTLNASKTQYMIFHRKQRLLPDLTYGLSLDGESLARVYTCRFLGVILDPNLTWNNHTFNVARKITKYAPIFWRIRNLCGRECLLNLYHALVYSNLIYCNSVWGFCIKSFLDSLFLAQKKIVRAIAGVGRRHHSLNLFNELKILNICYINKFTTGLLVQKMLNNIDFQSWFVARETPYDTRHMLTAPLQVGILMNRHSSQCISHRGPSVWNLIPVELRNSSYELFKRNYKTHLLHLQSNNF